MRKSSVFFNLANISYRKVKDISSVIGNPENIFKIGTNALRQIPVLTEKNINEILGVRKSGLLDKELALIEKEKIEILDIFDENYPSLLKEINSPPLVLYIKGNTDVLNKDLFAIVGTRMPTIYGLLAAKQFSYDLASLGLVIVSGLARGIDTAAHQQAITIGCSIAVLGSGLLNIYPRENKQLARNISIKGAVISEFPLLTSPARENFPRRNRIISGLSKGVLVVEAAVKSGALITAHLACEQNREVFAIPGKIDSPVSKGTHLLIKEGAKLTNTVEDILEELNISVTVSLRGANELLKS
jgi:DNA processing protein